MLAVFLTYFVNFGTPEWMLLEQVDDYEELTKFVQSKQWNPFSLEKAYLDFFAQSPKRNLVIDKSYSG